MVAPIPTTAPSGEFDGENVRSPPTSRPTSGRSSRTAIDDRIVVVGHHPIVSNGEYAGQRTVGQTLATLGVGPLVGQTVGTSRAEPRLGALPLDARRSSTASSRARTASSTPPPTTATLETFDVVRSEINRQTYLVSGTGGGRRRAGRPRPRRRAPAARARATSASSTSPTAASGPRRSRWTPPRAGTTVVFRHEVADANPELTSPEIPETTARRACRPRSAAASSSRPRSTSRRARSATASFHAVLLGRGLPRRLGHARLVARAGPRDGGRRPDCRSTSGGGNQTTGLRLEGADGREYGLRLVEKGGTGQIPEELRDGVAGSVVLDLRSAQTPFGAHRRLPALARGRRPHRPPAPRLRPRRPAPGPLPRALRQPRRPARGPRRRRHARRRGLRRRRERHLRAQPPREAARQTRTTAWTSAPSSAPASST